MAGMPINIPVPTEGLVASYNATDIIDGFGYATLYASQQSSSAGVTQELVTTLEKSSVVEVDYTSGITKDFDTGIYNSPRTIKGDAKIFFTMKKTTGSHYGIFTLKRVRGAVVTDISTTTNTVAITSEQTIFMRLPIPNQVMIAKGDKIRLTATTNIADGSHLWFGTEPTGVAGAGITTTGNTKTKLLIPFKIDL